MSRWLTTVPAAVLVINWTLCLVSRPTAHERSMTSWSSAGIVLRCTGRRSARYTCSCSARTWATHRPLSTLMIQDPHRLCRSSQLLRRLNCWELPLCTQFRSAATVFWCCAGFICLNCTLKFIFYINSVNWRLGLLRLWKAGRVTVWCLQLTPSSTSTVLRF